MKAILFGASGGLATALAERLLSDGWDLDLVTRATKRDAVEARFASTGEGRVRILASGERYDAFHASQPYDAHVFMQALFEPIPLVEQTAVTIAEEIAVGLTEPIRLTGELLARFPPPAGARRNFCYIGSTSAYAGFRNTAVYCAVKHGLLGFVRAMNDEYAQTDVRFWLFSMGTMATAMGDKVTGQDATSYLRPEDVAARIAEAIENPSNIHEPEVVMRRRTIRRRES